MDRSLPAGAGEEGLPWGVLIALLAIFVVRGLILACVLPPFEAWDEYQHVGYIDHAATSEDPAVFGATVLDADFTRAVAAFPQPEYALAQIVGAVGYEAWWDGAPRPARATQPVGLYQAQHSPLYYRLVAPLYRMSGGRANLRLVVSLLRLVNLAFGAGAMLLLLLWMRRRMPRRIALPAACCVILQPLLLLNLVRVSSDALGFLLGTMVVLSCFAIDERQTMIRWLLLAILLPLAVLAKANNLALLPLVMVVAGLQFLKSKATAAAGLAAVFLGLLIGTWPYFSFNLHHFGVLTPMQESIVNRAAGRSLWTILTSPPPKFWLVMTRALWIRSAFWVGGWSFLSLPAGFSAIYEAFLGIGAAAVAVGLFRRPSRIGILILLLLGCIHAGLMYHALESYSAWSGIATTNPWYAAVAIPWLLILIAGAWITSPFPRIGAAIAFALAALELIGETWGTWFRMIPFYYRGRTTAETFDRISLLHPAGLGSATLMAMTMLLAGLVISCGLVALLRPETKPWPGVPALKP